MNSVELVITHITGRRAGESLTCRTWPATIGRAPTNTVQLATHDTRASAKHAELQFDGANFFLRDLGSTNGTFLRGQRITRVRLNHGDIIEFGIGGPQIRFDFVQPALQPGLQPPPPQSPAPTPDGTAVLGSNVPVAQPQFVQPPPAQAQPLPAGPPPQLPVPSSQPPVQALPPTRPDEPPHRVPVSDDWAGNAPSNTMHLGTREFPLREQTRYGYYIAGFLLLAASLLLTYFGFLIYVLPSGFLGLFLLFTGWSHSRVNITITHKGIEYQGIWKEVFIPWQDIVELRAEQVQTRSLEQLVYTVKSPKHTIKFTASGFSGGVELAQLINRRTGRRWNQNN